MFRIRKEGTQLYSTGGSNPKFNKLGKTWTGKGALKLHLRLFITDRNWNTVKEWKNNIPRDWEVVELQRIELSEGQFAYVENAYKAYTVYPVNNPHIVYKDYEEEIFRRQYPLTFDHFDRHFSDLIKALPISEKEKLILINKLNRFVKSSYFYTTKIKSDGK